MSGKIKLLMLLLATALPLALATWLFQAGGGEWLGTTNRGRLIRPVLDASELGLRDESGQPVFRLFEETVGGVSPSEYEPRPWALLYLGGPECGAECRDRLYFLGQVHRRLGAEGDRLMRYYVNAGGALAPGTRELLAGRFPEMQIVHAGQGEILAVLARIHGENESPVRDHFIYLVDPAGNVMLYFTPENTAEDILADIDTLLSRSSLG